ncbi:MAG TPA: hypothetical protein VMM38_14765 [Aridibacter sp.]|nr:hypothetical protein [Aridibacter sp.]
MAKKILFALLIGAALCVLVFTVSPVLSDSLRDPTSGSQRQVRFRYVSGGDSGGDTASYIFHSSDERVFKTYTDCIGCPPYEVGDTQLYRQFMSKEQAEEFFDGYGEPDSDWTIEDGPISDKDGAWRKIAVLRSESGEVVVASVIWIEPTKRTYAYWYIQAPTAKIAKEFEQSHTFQAFKKTISPEPPACDTYGSNSGNYDWCR